MPIKLQLRHRFVLINIYSGKKNNIERNNEYHMKLHMLK